MKLCKRYFQTKLLSRLSHKVCLRLSSPILLRKFTVSVPNQSQGSSTVLEPFPYATVKRPTTANKKSVTCFATSLRNELNSDRFLRDLSRTLEPLLQQIRLQRFFSWVKKHAAFRHLTRHAAVLKQVALFMMLVLQYLYVETFIC